MKFVDDDDDDDDQQLSRTTELRRSISVAVKVFVLLELNPVGNLPHRNGQRKAYIWPC